MTPTAVDHQALGAAGPWIDTHCHLDIGDDGDDRAAQDAVVADARANGVARLITIATDVASARVAIAIAGRHDDVWASVGLHPHDAKHGIDGLEALLGEPGVVAVGECGLDYHYEHSPRATQQEAFAAQIALAHAYDRTLVIHTRNAWDDTFAMLDDQGMPPRTVIHCFTGGPDEAKACLDRGAYLSFSGIATFKNAREVRDAAALCPDDRLLIETDSPFLAPVPYRGKPNQPGWVPVVGAAIAQTRATTPEHVAALVWQNAAVAFNL